MSDLVFPLSWPAGKPRAHDHKPALFRDGVARIPLHTGIKRLRHALDLLRATEIAISSNIRPRVVEEPPDNLKTPNDPGVAVYFRVEEQAHCLACDRWQRVAENMAAIAAHIEALRGQARWGVGDLMQALGGYRALPAMGASATWWQVLTFEQPPRDKAEAEAKYYELLKRHHPDRHNGSEHASNQAAEVTAAWREAERYYSEPR